MRPRSCRSVKKSAQASVDSPALLVGVRGQVIGVDITPAMVQKARRNVQLAGLTNVTVCEADIAYLPLPDEGIDTVISNGSINLAPDKARVFG
ncbi:MAG TPA: methyltransferase domain-containing protein [Mycobacterium sp.]|nr:methyltransferase domain-containing protein [Mycobacterium sp.]